MDIPYTDPVTLLPIPDFQTGCDIVARLPLVNPPQAANDLVRLLDSLQAFPPDGESYLKLLEQMRLPAAFVTGELAKRYLAKPLPLGEVEERVFRLVTGLWLKTAKAYAHCTGRDQIEDDIAYARRVAMVLHRCIQHTGMAVFEHQRARRELPWGLWLDIHGYYASAEEWNVASLAIPDPLDPLGRETNCMAAYVTTLLCDMASPYSLSLRDQSLVRRWATLWSPLISVHPVTAGETLPAFVIELMQDAALRPVADCLHTEHLRRLDTSRLAQQMIHVRQQLRQRVTPAQLLLGDDCTAGQCVRLLDYLSRPWSQARAARKFRRHATSGIASLCTSFEEMHYFISGQPFVQPENVRTYSRKDFDRLFAFRFQTNPQQTLHLHKEQLPYRTDDWEVINQSANGFRLARSIAGRKMEHGQLLAICPHDGERYLLAKITWLMQEKEGGLVAGLMALPGMPEAIAARPLDALGRPDGLYQRAFLLPAINGMENGRAERSLVVPPGWFRSGQRVELFTDGAWQIEFKRVLDQGADFERLSFEVC
ncbi:hypothetical protein [Propionivibrio limicola]|uniref:hypothetical protein n=1 Tax=Propionivibrio limicola TaxID=167645 RepID=UPI001292A607|nr:hypothetical protein [Propionivibrio limicola]